jgi:hypothetical protein
MIAAPLLFISGVVAAMHTMRRVITIVTGTALLAGRIDRADKRRLQRARHLALPPEDEEQSFVEDQKIRDRFLGLPEHVIKMKSQGRLLGPGGRPVEYNGLRWTFMEVTAEEYPMSPAFFYGPYLLHQKELTLLINVLKKHQAMNPLTPRGKRLSEFKNKKKLTDEELAELDRLIGAEAHPMTVDIRWLKIVSQRRLKDRAFLDKIGMNKIPEKKSKK